MITLVADGSADYCEHDVLEIDIAGDRGSSDSRLP
jgi:hypothetical protein